jgi:predicted ATP-grasp superfamily ATP-dependent carboligase
VQAGEYLLLAGASVRAAAFSALRAGLRPWCVDLFADADLEARCPVVALPAERYPHGLVEVFAKAPPGSWLYTGALENRPRLVQQLSRGRPLWGNDAAVLKKVRAPLAVATVLQERGIACPALRLRPPGAAAGRWLVKPLAGAGGRGIAIWTADGRRASPRSRVYWQESIEGTACAAVYVGDGSRAQLVGVTQQLVGEGWLHAAPFHYCGSIGPLGLAPALVEAFHRLGTALAEGLQLRGLFGVDCVLRDGVPLPVEVNPRYTASVEILEYGAKVPALALHCRVFDQDAPAPTLSAGRPDIVGKAILFARQPLTFPADGPWTVTLRRPGGPWELPAFADLPHPGQRIEAGRPVLTFFARALSMADCLDQVRRTAAELDRCLSGTLG